MQAELPPIRKATAFLASTPHGLPHVPPPLPALTPAGPHPQLALCDCHVATGEPHGLGCAKEGYMITGFENQGTWLSGGGLVPLSRAICCRPCLPQEAPPPAGGAPAPGGGASADDGDGDDAPVSVVSLGCHPSSNRGAQAHSCEASSHSFVTGFSQAERVSSVYLE